MPVRKIPYGRLTVTGVCPAGKSILPAEFESPLERDLYILLDTEPDVVSFEPQPLWIEIPGRRKPYPPDVAVVYRSYTKDNSLEHKVVVEVKPRRDLWEGWTKFRPKFKATIHQLGKEGTRFKILTEREIRTPYLRNRIHLRPYLRGPLDPDHTCLLQETILLTPGISPEALLRAIAPSGIDAGRLIWSIWQLVAKDFVEVDLGYPLSMTTSLFPLGAGIPRTHLAFPSFRLVKSIIKSPEVSHA